MNINTLDTFIEEARAFSLTIDEKNTIRTALELSMHESEEKSIQQLPGERLVSLGKPFVTFKKYSATFSLIVYGIIHSVWKKTRPLKK